MALITRTAAAERGDELALADDHVEVTWAALDERVNRLANALTDAGLGHGDTVAVVTGNRVEWFEIALACAHTGVVFVPVNWHLVAGEMAYIFGDADARWVFAGHRFADTVLDALTHDSSQSVERCLVIGAASGSDGGAGGSASADGLGGESVGSTPTDASAAPAGGDDPTDNPGAGTEVVDYASVLAASDPGDPEQQVFGGPMFYTSGTTGQPKGVRSGISSMGPDVGPEMWQLIGGGFASFVDQPGVTALCGPIYHSAQWAFSFMPLVAGSTVVMQHKYDSAGLLDLIDRYGATNVHLVPTQMKRLLDLPESTKESFDGSSMEYVIHGASPCPPAVKRGMIDWWGPKIVEYYGSTEGSLITRITSEQWLAKGGSVGPPEANFEVMVVGEDGEHLGPNEPGTLYFRNLMGMAFEYHKAPEKTAAAHLEPGVFTTGDVGYLDDDGFLWLSDRKIDMIISGGVNIYPAEIEGVLGGHPDVADAAVIGVPNEEFGEEVKAVVVAAEGVAAEGVAERLVAHCREHLAGYKVPRSVDLVAEIPRTGTGKIRKRDLREPYWEGTDRAI